ncbi:LPXTG cell wall anchor domain-containing protein [Streptomyces sp. c-19]|uniref:LPXTG cell wall anchor domain-containing protein n=1 Tax=Streptomyces sp. c-19 TaxID=2789275 RepID=UPI003980EE96
MRRSLISAGALVAAVAGSLVLAPAASASEGKTYELPLHQPTNPPISASEFAKEGEDCPGIPSDKDGWHFIIPGKGVEFTKLTVTFDNGDPIVVTDFGPPKDDHAYVASEPGAKLTSAVAEVNGVVEQGWFNLSHACLADVTSTPTGTPSTSAPTPTDTPSTGTPTGTPSGTPSVTPSESVSPTASPSVSETPGGTASPSASTPAGETGGTGGTGGTDGDLAETGSSAPVGILAAVAVALAGAGAFLVTRRRKAGQQG